jgi:hypothetical protein
MEMTKKNMKVHAAMIFPRESFRSFSALLLEMAEFRENERRIFTARDDICHFFDWYL